MKSQSLFVGVVVLMTVATANAQVVDPILFNAISNSGGDEAPGLGTNYASSGQVGGGTDDEEGAFGNNDGPVEGNTFIFNDGGVIDNGNGILGDGGETVDSLSWDTTSLVLIEGFRATINGDSGGPSRATELIGFSVAGELDDLFDNNAAAGVVDRVFAIPQLGNGFVFNSTRTSGTGPRISEIDAIVSDPPPANAVIDPILFNAITNNIGEGDEAPGLATNFVVSSALGGDTPEDAFGNSNGAIEPNTFLFADGGVADNGNNLLEGGTETIDSIAWDTTSVVSIAGYEIVFAGDTGVQHAFRGTELLNFLVEGVVIDTIDLNGYGGGAISIQRFFDGGALSGDDFEVQLTRSSTGGSRIFEINAIVVPEPASATLFLLGILGLGLIARRRRSGE